MKGDACQGHSIQFLKNLWVLWEMKKYTFTVPGCTNDSAQHAAHIKPGILPLRPVTSNEVASKKLKSRFSYLSYQLAPTQILLLHTKSLFSLF